MNVVQVFNFRNLYGSGLTESVPSLCTGLSHAGVETNLFAPSARQEWHAAEFTMHEHPVISGFSSLGWSPSMLKALRQMAEQASMIHCHELWTLPGVYASRVAQEFRKPIVISPRGTLSSEALRYSGWRKQLMWRWRRRQDILAADCVHATADHECADIRAAGYRGPVAVIPNSLSVPELSPRNHGVRRRLVYLGRIHPIKGVTMLVDIWKSVFTQFPEWELEIAGIDDGGYKEQLQQRADELCLERFRIRGPVFGQEKTDFLASADLFCLPTTSDNFAITVGEALAHCVPVVTTTAAPWKPVVDHKCGWWVAPKPGAVRTALETAMKLTTEQLQLMGKRGRDWVRQNFCQDSVATQMKETYEWLLGQTTQPDWINEEIR
ncbi:MAG: glycosyltransferase [Fuerstiella sp.]|nr:glycosyltransferase [Fuerstiella sp.]